MSFKKVIMSVICLIYLSILLCSCGVPAMKDGTQEQPGDATETSEQEETEVNIYIQHLLGHEWYNMQFYPKFYIDEEKVVSYFFDEEHCEWYESGPGCLFEYNLDDGSFAITQSYYTPVDPGVYVQRLSRRGNGAAECRDWYQSYMDDFIDVDEEGYYQCGRLTMSDEVLRSPVEWDGYTLDGGTIKVVDGTAFISHKYLKYIDDYEYEEEILYPVLYSDEYSLLYFYSVNLGFRWWYMDDVGENPTNLYWTDGILLLDEPSELLLVYLDKNSMALSEKGVIIGAQDSYISLSRN